MQEIIPKKGKPLQDIRQLKEFNWRDAKIGDRLYVQDRSGYAERINEMMIIGKTKNHMAIIDSKYKDDRSDLVSTYQREGMKKINTFHILESSKLLNKAMELGVIKLRK